MLQKVNHDFNQQDCRGESLVYLTETVEAMMEKCCGYYRASADKTEDRKVSGVETIAVKGEMREKRRIR